MCNRVDFFVQPAREQESGDDHPLLSRFAPATLTHYNQVNYNAVKFPAGPIGENEEPEHMLEPEGRITWIGYRVPEEHSRLEVIRNYDDAFAGSDIEILFSCEGPECGDAKQLRSWLAGNTFAQGTTSQNSSPEKWIDWTRNDERMVANGVACMAPITSNSTEEGREQNRWVELVFGRKVGQRSIRA